MAIALDASVQSQRAFVWTIQNALPAHVQLDAIHVQSAGPKSSKFEAAKENSERILDAYVNTCAQASVRQRIHKKILFGKPGPALEEYCKEHDVQLLIVACRGWTGRGRSFSSVTDHVLHKVKCPVLVYKDMETKCKGQSNKARPSQEEGDASRGKGTMGTTENESDGGKKPFKLTSDQSTSDQLIENMSGLKVSNSRENIGKLSS